LLLSEKKISPSFHRQVGSTMEKKTIEVVVEQRQAMVVGL
jgi:hypothetical protein